MRKQDHQKSENTPLRMLVVIACMTMLIIYIQPLTSFHYWLRVFLLLIIGKVFLQFLCGLPEILYRFLIHRLARRKTVTQGSACLATDQDMKKSGHFHTKGFFMGCSKETGRPVFIKNHSHGLTLSPAGGGKTVNFAVPVLLHNRMSIFVTDLKGTLACITAFARKKYFGHDIYVLNPAHLYCDILGVPSRYNPLILVISAWKTKAYADMVAYAEAIALHLCPEPPKQGDNTYFRNESRALLKFCFLYLSIYDAENTTLTQALMMLRDETMFKSALYTASCSDDLKGDLASLAQDILQKITAEDTRQWNSFRNGAVQALSIFAPSSYLAESSLGCDFRFSDLKHKKMTVYLISDPSKNDIYAPWVGLIAWCAMQELLQHRSNKKVLFLLDEATNFVIQGISKMLTALREYGIQIWFVVQELEEYARLYGRENLETMLSQTETKQIFGIQNIKTAELFSKTLGDTTIKTLNYHLGRDMRDDVTHSMTDLKRPIMTAEELRRFDDCLILHKNEPAIITEKTGYHEVSPWFKIAKPNPMHGTKRYKGKIRLCLKY